MSRVTRSIIAGIVVSIVVFIKELFFNPLTSNAILDFVITVIILYIAIVLADVIGKKISKKK